MVNAILIIQMLGEPKEHVVETLSNHIDGIGKIKNVSIISKNISEPKLDDATKLYLCFADVEIECPNFGTLLQIVMDYMPSSVEVVEPSEININCKDSTDMLNYLVTKLHSYDAIVRELDIRLKSATKIMTDNGILEDGKLTKEALDKIKK